ncbi:MAG: ComEC/Rec2 family competence protein [Rickettsiales bacterium]|jgi:competence protein ComEC|nr:ComEC/Rec2 family competence protein [Rickettsiales bacterium]
MKDSFLFSCVFSFAAGIALYFVLPFEPIVRFPILICCLCLACFVKYRRIIFLFIFGFFYAVLRAGWVDTKLLAHSRLNSDVAGFVMDIEHSADRKRVFVRTADDLLFQISIPFDCAIGSDFIARANIYSPTAADAFSRFDYRRWSFFNGLSGNGSATSGECGGAGRQTFRDWLHEKANNKLADSLALGYKNAIPRADYDKIKAAGIAHIFSISGYHLTLVGGWLFLIFYFFVRLSPRLTRRFPAKNLALPITALGLAFYLFLSGMAVATIRSFIMASVGFLAALLNRRVLTVRNAALVFALMILIRPFWLVSSGFQLSFAAIFGLLHFFENRKIKGNGIGKFFYVLAISSAIATIWTFPFVVYHFGNFPVYGLLGNLILLPIFSIMIMPIVMIGMLTSIIGWTWPFHVSDYLYDIVIVFSDWISNLPFAAFGVSDIPPFCLFLIFAGMFAVILKKRKKSIIIFIAAFLYWLIRPVPVLRATADNEVVGFTRAGKTYFNVGYSANHPFIIPRANRLKADCKKGICEYKTENWSAVSVQRFIPLINNLDRFCDYDFIISYLPLNLPMCQYKIIDGGLKIYSDGRIEKTHNEERLWNK